MSLKVIAFDLFGTVLDLSNVRREEIVSYLRQCTDPVWKPLELPDSWEKLPAYKDSREGISRLRTKYEVITLSNAPKDLTEKVLKYNDIEVDRITNLADIKRYKPHPECYWMACEWADVGTWEATMVTGNPTFGPYPFGDIQVAKAVGMQGHPIRTEECPTIIALAELLGC